MKEIAELLKKQKIGIPAWAFGNAGTRFHVFSQEAPARTIEEKLEDAAQVHAVTGVCPETAIIASEQPAVGWEVLKAKADELGIRITSVIPNHFSDDGYKLGSVCHPDPDVRRRAVDHIIDAMAIARILDAPDLCLWFADGTNYPGQDDMRQRKHRLEEALQAVYVMLDDDMRMLIEYKCFEPAFYHTDIADWGSALLLAQKLGDRAQVLVDLGHHAPGTNIEQIVTYLIDEGKLGGFHFNNKKYADDDLTVGSMNPYEFFLIYNELAAAGDEVKDVSYVIDQAHIVKNTQEAMIQSVMTIQETYAKALHVDREALAAARREGRIIDAEECLKDAYHTDVRPLLRDVREEMGLDPEPLKAFRKSGYLAEITAARKSGQETAVC